MVYRCNRACLLRLQHLEQQRSLLSLAETKRITHSVRTLGAERKKPAACNQSKSKERLKSTSISVKELATNEESCLTTTRWEGNIKSQPTRKKTAKYESVDHSNILSFDVKGVIGKGAFGDILLARCEQDRSMYAMKRMILEPPENLDLDRRTYMSLIKQEVKALTANAMSTDNHFLLALKTWLVADGYIYIVTDFFNGGDLEDMREMFPDSRIPEHMVQFYCAEMAAAIGFVHKLGMLHCDIKLENFLICHDGHIVLCDFGMVTWDTSMTVLGGTYEFMAPERLLERDDFGNASDWWSLAICIHLMLFGKHPMWDDELSREENLGNIARYQITVEGVDYVRNYYAYTFLEQMLMYHAERRLGHGPNGFQNVLNHPYLFNIDRSKLLSKKLIPPTSPKVKDPEDYSHFSFCEELNPEIPRRVVTHRHPVKS